MQVGPQNPSSRRLLSNGMMSEINITPFVDVILVLLIVFMVTAPLAISGVDVQLPASKAKNVSTKSTPLILTVTQKGEYFLGKSKIEAGELEAKLQASKGADQDASLLIRADRRTQYEALMLAMAAAQRAGIQKIGMLSESKQ